MYPLRAINRRLVEIIGACYTNSGLISERVAVYAPYSSTDRLCRPNSNVRREGEEEEGATEIEGADLVTFRSHLLQVMTEKFRCGAEFLPSPMASKAEFALTSDPALVREGHLTAVAVASDTGHAVAFLGTATGEVRGGPAGY